MCAARRVAEALQKEALRRSPRAGLQQGTCAKPLLNCKAELLLSSLDRARSRGLCARNEEPKAEGELLDMLEARLKRPGAHRPKSGQEGPTDAAVQKHKVSVLRKIYLPLPEKPGNGAPVVAPAGP